MKKLFPLTVLLLMAGRAYAATPIDKDATLICAVVDLASCLPGEGCQRETSDSINAPQLLTVDVKGQAVTAHRPDGTLLSSGIDHVTRTDTLLVLDGIQNELSWTMTIANDSGHMSLAAIGDEQAYQAFGTCEPR